MVVGAVDWGAIVGSFIAVAIVVLAFAAIRFAAAVTSLNAATRDAIAAGPGAAVFTESPRVVATVTACGPEFYRTVEDARGGTNPLEHSQALPDGTTQIHLRVGVELRNEGRSSAVLQIPDTNFEFSELDSGDRLSVVPVAVGNGRYVLRPSESTHLEWIATVPTPSAPAQAGRASAVFDLPVSDHLEQGVRDDLRIEVVCSPVAFNAEGKPLLLADPQCEPIVHPTRRRYPSEAGETPVRPLSMVGNFSNPKRLLLITAFVAAVTGSAFYFSGVSLDDGTACGSLASPGQIPVVRAEGLRALALEEQRAELADQCQDARRDRILPTVLSGAVAAGALTAGVLRWPSRERRDGGEAENTGAGHDPVPPVDAGKSSDEAHPAPHAEVVRGSA